MKDLFAGELQAGDEILITNARDTSGLYKNGDVLIISDIHADHVNVEFTNSHLPIEYIIHLEECEPYKEFTKADLKLGMAYILRNGLTFIFGINKDIDGDINEDLTNKISSALDIMKVEETKILFEREETKWKEVN